jgi:hypothetical protein
MPPHNSPGNLAVLEPPRAVRFDPAALAYEAYSLGARTDLKGALNATTLEQAQAEATDRWHWDRGDRLGIREVGHADAPFWPFEKQAFDRLHVFAVQRSAPLRWRPVDYGTRTEPVYRYSLKLLTTIDLGVFRGEGFRWQR